MCVTFRRKNKEVCVCQQMTLFLVEVFVYCFMKTRVSQTRVIDTLSTTHRNKEHQINITTLDKRIPKRLVFFILIVTLKA